MMRTLLSLCFCVQLAFGQFDVGGKSFGGGHGFKRHVASGLPDDTTNIKQWFDASDASTLFKDTGLTTAATANNDSVGGWKDKSPTALNIIGTNKMLLKTSYQNGRNAVLSDGSNDFLQSTSDAMSLSFPITVVLVYKYISGTVMVDGGGGGLNRVTYQAKGSGDQAYMIAGSGSAFPLVNNAVPINGVRIACLIYNGVSSTWRINGGLDTTVSGTPGTNTTLTGITIGANNTGGTPASVGFMEVRYYSGAKSAQQMTAIVAYLNYKWVIY